MKIFYFVSILFFAITSCNNSNAVETNDSSTSTQNTSAIKPQFEVIKQYPHNTSSFTEGLEYIDSIMYESTGQFGQSKLAKVDLKTGQDLLKIDIDKKYFGEGITTINNKLFMVTYQTEKGFVFHAKTFKKLSEFSYKGEGWGMTNDGKQIIMSNGTNNLSYRNATTFAEETVKAIFDENGPVGNINELEYVDGCIYANIWQTNYIVKIDPKQGKVIAKYDLTSIVNQYITNSPNADVLNGIAYNKKSKTFYITGKNWPLLFEIKFN
jgi:glutamine cyclotransferase